jgi:hypothetical protein
MPKPPNSWIHTATGKHFDPLNPDSDLIDIRDIAHALSMQCRFVGHVKDFYSVAEHSVRVSRACAERDALAGLLHDAPEAYLHDLASPIKHAAGMERYREAEALLEAMIYGKWGLAPTMPASVRKADKTLLNTEARDLFGGTHVGWANPEDVLIQTIRPVGAPRAAEEWFLQRYRALTRVKVTA